jgi:hypothetical protein
LFVGARLTNISKDRPTVTFDPSLGYDAIEVLLQHNLLNHVSDAGGQWQKRCSEYRTQLDHIHNDRLRDMAQEEDRRSRLYEQVACVVAPHLLACRFPWVLAVA